jgi:hypothetical protein
MHESELASMNRLKRWFGTRSPRGQWTAGCAGVLAVISLCLYSLGLVSYIMRPTLVATPSVATVVFAVPTVSRPTFAAATVPPTLALPGSTLEATPTQAPIPTNAPPTETETPTLALDANGNPIPITTTPDATEFFHLAQTAQP